MGILTLNQSNIIVITETINEEIHWQTIDSYCEITRVVPMAFYGAIAASEFLTYDPAKLYFGLDFQTSYTTGVAVVNPAFVTFYDYLNAIDFYLTNVSAVWDTTAVSLKYSNNNAILKNIIFSRVLFNVYSHIHFSGYRLTITV